MSEMKPIERIARAMMKAGYLDENDSPEQVELCWQSMDGVRQCCLDMARAALLAIREPDCPTLAAMFRVLDEYPMALEAIGAGEMSMFLTAMFRAAIDNALEE